MTKKTSKIVEKLKTKQKKVSAAEKRDLKLLEMLKDKFTYEELKQIVKGSLDINNIKDQKKISVDFSGQRIKFGCISDTHIGSKYFKPELLEAAFKMFKKEGCEFITHSGDVTDGFSNRPGHIYELDHPGYQAQLEYAREIFAPVKIPIYMVDGNHDRYYIKSAGAILVKELAKSQKNIEFLGHDIADFYLKDKVKVCLWHGEDGSSYATSYRLQKIAESLTGGDKPHVIIAGHTHKEIAMFERNIHIVSAGAISLQSAWMKSKKLANHTGFHIIDMTIRKNTVARFRDEWFPFYV